MDIKELVAQQLVNSASSIKDKVVESLYTDELNKRINACLKVITQIADLEKEYKKLNKPDIENYGEDGIVVTKFYSKELAQNLGTLKQKRTKLESALERVLEQNDFSNVLELGK